MTVAHNECGPIRQALTVAITAATVRQVCIMMTEILHVGREYDSAHKRTQTETHQTCHRVVPERTGKHPENHMPGLDVTANQCSCYHRVQEEGGEERWVAYT